MTGNDYNSDLQMIRIDRDHIRLLPDEVARAAEVLVSYIAGLDQGTRLPDDPDGPDDSGYRSKEPPASAAGGEGERESLEQQAAERVDEEMRAAGSSDGGISWDEVFGGTCKPIYRPQDQTPGSSAVPLEIVVVWRARRFPDRRAG